MSVISYNMDKNWALQEVQLAVNVIDSLFISHFAT